VEFATSETVGLGQVPQDEQRLDRPAVFLQGPGQGVLAPGHLELAVRRYINP
jgi:hypothetical protein